MSADDWPLPFLPVEVACGRDDDDAVALDPRQTSNEDGHLEADEWWERNRTK